MDKQLHNVNCNHHNHPMAGRSSAPISPRASTENLRQEGRSSNESRRSPRNLSPGVFRMPSITFGPTINRTTNPNHPTTRKTSQILLTERKVTREMAKPMSPSLASVDVKQQQHDNNHNNNNSNNSNNHSHSHNNSNNHHNGSSLKDVSLGGGPAAKTDDAKIPSSIHSRTSNAPPSHVSLSSSTHLKQGKKTGDGNGNDDDPTKKWEYHFLIVDDTPSNRRMLQMVLNKRNIHCDVAQDGKEAVDMVAAHGDRYDFIFMVKN